MLAMLLQIAVFKIPMLQGVKYLVYSFSQALTSQCAGAGVSKADARAPVSEPDITRSLPLQH
jgi:hypothetical protein